MKALNDVRYDKVKQWQPKYWNDSSLTFRNLFLAAVVLLVILPFWITSQEFLTRIVMSFGWYRGIQQILVPYELRIVATILHLLGFSVQVGSAYLQWQNAHGNSEAIYLAWNCIGWQTAILLAITLLTGLSGRHTFGSKLETLGIGILGTYLINITRLVLIIIVYMHAGRVFGTVFHDYFSNIFTLSWLGFYWWFSFSYILKEK